METKTEIDHATKSEAPKPGRRRWTEDEKRAVVAEANAPGAVIAEVARRHGVLTTTLFDWRKRAKNGSAPKENGSNGATAAGSQPAPMKMEAAPQAIIEIEAQGVLVRIPASEQSIAAVIGALLGAGC